MKNNYPVLFLLSFAALFFFSCQQQSNEKTSEGIEEEKKPNDWFLRQRAFPYEKPDKQAYLAAQRFRQEAVRNNRSAEEWIFCGPTNIGGRITDIEMPLSNTNTIYVAAAAGGIFKTLDQGDTWTPIFDDAMSLSIGDMDISESNESIIYVGTGEANSGGGSLAYDGVGVYKSEDAGDTWIHVGLENVGSIGRILIDPDNPDRVFVAAMGDLFGNTPDRGVYRSLDGGASWEKILFVANNTGAIDLAINPDNPDIIFAAMWERERTPQNIIYGGANSGVYRSTDGGNSWEELGGGLPTAAADKGRIALAIAPSHPDTVYAFYARRDGFVNALFRSTDGGESWDSRGSNGVNSVAYMWWFSKLFVHPTDPDDIYYAGFHFHHSENGGQSFSRVFQGAHVDQHALFIHPAQPGLVLAGNDGGLYLSYDGGLIHSKIDNLPITQFYTCEIDESFPERLYGGTQDNSSMRTTSGEVDDWSIIYFGDGFYTLVDPLDNTFVYTEYQYGNFAKSTNGGFSFQPALEGISFADRMNWNTPVVFDPTNPSTLYYGASRLYKTENRADSWIPISQDLSNGPGGGSRDDFGTITTISVSPLDNQVIYAGTDDGNVWVTVDGADNWNNISAELPQRWVTRVSADPFDPESVYVTISGYRYHEDMAHVYKSEDHGDRWINIGESLPDVPVNDIIIREPGILAIASDIGVFVSDNDGTNWDLLSSGLPNVVITDLDYHETTRTLVAATYGRSMYKYEFEESVGVKSPEKFVEISISPNPVVEDALIQLKDLEPGRYSLNLFDEQGRMVKIIFEGRLSNSSQVFQLAGGGLSSGMYILRISGMGKSLSKKIVKL